MIIDRLGYANEELLSKAQELATQLGFIVEKQADTCLYLSSQGLALKYPNLSLMQADFSDKTWAKRKSEGKKQGLIKACKPQKGMKIIDTTAGWGRDGAILASFGAEVLLLERNKVMAALIADALERQSQEDKRQLIISFRQADAKEFLKGLNPDQYPDVIYIDPMHPERSKSALVKKELQVLQQLLGVDVDAIDLLQEALQRARQRVVVKWPQKAKPLLNPQFSIEGKTVRFDVYLPS